MIIPNGKLIRIDTPAAVGVAGDVTYANGPALDVDVTIDQPTGSQRYVQGAAIKDASAVVYVMSVDVGGGAAVDQGFRVVTQLEVDGVLQPAVTYRVIKRVFRAHDELSHFELYCQEAALS